MDYIIYLRLFVRADALPSVSRNFVSRQIKFSDLTRTATPTGWRCAPSGQRSDSLHFEKLSAIRRGQQPWPQADYVRKSVAKLML